MLVQMFGVLKFIPDVEKKKTGSVGIDVFF